MEPNEKTASEHESRKQLHDIAELLERTNKRFDTESSERKEVTERLTEAMRELAEKMGQSGGRRSEPELNDADGRDPVAAESMKEILSEPAYTDETRRIHTLSDNLFIMKHILRTEDGRERDVRSTEYYRKTLKELAKMKSVSTAGGSIGNWVPTAFSASLHEQVRLALRVAALHDRIEMPQDPFKLPIEGTDATAYLVAEQGDSDANLDTSKMVTPSFSGGSQPGATVLTLTSKKLGARTTFSAEAEEESIIPVFPYFRKKIVYAIASAIENATINGDTAGTQDSDISSTADARRAWDGYRKHAPSATKIANTVSSKTRIGLTDLRTLRMNMGVYGAVDPERVTFITGPVGAIKMLQVEDPMSSTNPSPVLTKDKYGDAATVLNGEIARIDGIPIVISPYVREDLTITGVYDGVTTDRTMVLCVNRDSFIYGDRRQLKVESERLITTDQTQMVCMLRMTFANWFATKAVVGFVYNIQK